MVIKARSQNQRLSDSKQARSESGSYRCGRTRHWYCFAPACCQYETASRARRLCAYDWSTGGPWRRQANRWHIAWWTRCFAHGWKIDWCAIKREQIAGFWSCRCLTADGRRSRHVHHDHPETQIQDRKLPVLKHRPSQEQRLTCCTDTLKNMVFHEITKDTKEVPG